MLITFQPQLILPIMRGTKIHTIREDKNNRWKAGMQADMWCRNPRNTHLNPFKLGIAKIESVSEIVIDAGINCVYLLTPHRRYYEPSNLDIFARQDGFPSWEEMKKFFPERFSGKLISWNPNIQFLKTIEEVQAITKN